MHGGFFLSFLCMLWSILNRLKERLVTYLGTKLGWHTRKAEKELHFTSVNELLEYGRKTLGDHLNRLFQEGSQFLKDI